MEGKPTIICTPTDELSEQYASDFAEKGIHGVIISRKHNPDYSSSQHLKDAVKAKAPLIFVNVDVLHRTDADLSGYEIFEDEICDIVKSISFEKAQYLRETLSKLIDVETTVATDYYRLTLTTTAIDIAAQGWEYDGIKENEKLLELAECIESRHHDVLVLAKSYNEYFDKKIQNIQFWSVLLPSVHDPKNPPIIVGANAEDRLLYKIWGNQVEFREPDFIRTQSFLKDKKAQARILYYSNQKMTGKRFNTLNQQRIADAIADQIAIDFPERKHIFGLNKKRFTKKPHDWKHENATGTRVRLVPHGQNGFKEYDMAVYVAAQYQDPATYKMLEKVYGISGDEVTRDFTYERLYQFLMRINARVKECKKDFVVIVPDKAAAEYVSEHFGGAPIEFYDIAGDDEELRAELTAEAPETQTAEERTARNTKGKAAKRAMEKEILNDHANTIQYDGFKFRLWSHKGCQEPVYTDLSWGDLTHFMKHTATTFALKSKYNAKEFREGFFEDTSKHTLKGNLKSAKLMLFECDKAKRDPIEMSKFLRKMNVTHIIHHSFSSTPLDQHFHVIVPLSEAVNQTNYKRIFHLLKADIQAWFGDDFEIEEKWESFNHRMSMPSISNFKGDLFIDGTVIKDGATYEISYLDVSWFLSRNQIAPKKVQPNVAATNATRTSAKETAEDIIARLMVAPGLGLGRKHFYAAGVELKKNGFSYGDVIQILTSNRHMFGHGQDRDAKAVADHVFSNSRVAA
ncbi:hypothetical protein CCGE532_14780 [Rhizobium sp. CCGE532]|nr:hypothetical protein CCGE532_14780 [Rhizobium sp. CCGE532]